MIDIHNHILPALDDGPATVEKSIEMARVAADDGIKVIVATPHFNNGIYKTSLEQILNEVERLNQLLEDKKIPITVLPGADVYLDCNLLKDIREQNIMTINNNRRYIILELPTSGLPLYLSEFIWELKLSGITPIFSHPERNEIIQDDINILYNFIMQGALSQITAMSLTGEFGKRAQKCAISLLKHNLTHVIATDAHSVRRRPPILSKALKVAQKIKGHDQALKMVTETPKKIIEGEQLSIPEPVKKANKFFSVVHS
jgi:protein-tyrosine phosphatase